MTDCALRLSSGTSPHLPQVGSGGPRFGRLYDGPLGASVAIGSILASPALAPIVSVSFGPLISVVLTPALIRIVITAAASAVTASTSTVTTMSVAVAVVPVAVVVIACVVIVVATIAPVVIATVVVTVVAVIVVPVAPVPPMRVVAVVAVVPVVAEVYGYKGVDPGTIPVDKTTVGPVIADNRHRAARIPVPPVVDVIRVEDEAGQMYTMGVAPIPTGHDELIGTVPEPVVVIVLATAGVDVDDVVALQNDHRGIVIFHHDHFRVVVFDDDGLVGLRFLLNHDRVLTGVGLHNNRFVDGVVHNIDTLGVVLHECALDNDGLRRRVVFIDDGLPAAGLLDDDRGRFRVRIILNDHTGRLGNMNRAIPVDRACACSNE